MNEHTQPAGAAVSDTTAAMLADPAQALTHLARGVAHSLRVAVGALALAHPEHAASLTALMADADCALEVRGIVRGGSSDIELTLLAHMPGQAEPVPIARQEFVAAPGGTAH